MKGILLITFLTISFAVTGQDDEGFVLVKSDPPFEVHERWVEFPNKKPAVTSRELKSEFTVRAPIYKIINLIKDEKQVRLWQSHLLNYKIYPTSDSTSWDEYSCHDVPWPLADQDSYMEYKLKEVKAGEEYQIIFKSKVDKKIAPVRENVNRIELYGSWKFVAVSTSVVKVTYRIQSVPATSVPRMIVDPVIRNNLVATVKSLTEIVEK
jgi:hypothetical protein